MTPLQTTVLLKTDIAGSTPRFRALLAADLQALVLEHRAFVAQHAANQEKLVVNGYTDNAHVGPTLRKQGITSNEMLSQKRAETVMQYMISQGVKPNLVTARGYGAADPVASNKTPQGRAENRRVEVTIAGANS
jgi:outer membrane protein OmpA-like peptidoglycan-associated protein